MPTTEVARSPTQAQSWSPILDDLITKIVAQRVGIKETELAMSVLVGLAENRIEASPEIILAAIQRLIRTGRLVGVDCQIGPDGYTFVLPAGSHVQVVMPVYVAHSGTRH